MERSQRRTFGDRSAVSGSGAHAVYRDRLQALDAAVLDELALPAPADRPGGWSRHAARFEPGRQPWATVVLERYAPQQELLTLRLFDRGAAPPGAVDGAAGPMVVEQFPVDALLSGLAAVAGADPSTVVVRYRPGRRCTLRTGDGGDTRFVKVLADAAAASRLHDEAVALWGAHRRGRLRCSVARPDRVDASLAAVWQYAVPGEPLLPRLATAEGPELCRLIGRALGELAGCPLQPQRVISADGQRERTERALRRVEAAGAHHGVRAARCWAQIVAARERAGAAALRPVHGSPHAHQWLVDGGGLGLVDFDRFARGEVELDIATFLGELDFDGRLHTHVDRFARAMADGYAETGVPVNRGLVEVYRLHKWVAKLGRSATALRADGDQRLDRLLGRLEAATERLR